MYDRFHELLGGKTYLLSNPTATIVFPWFDFVCMVIKQNIKVSNKSQKGEKREKLKYYRQT